MPDETNVAVIVGASGGIGAALTQQLVDSGHYGRVLALARRAIKRTDESLVAGYIDVTDEPSIVAAAEQARALGAVRLVIVASGVLHAAGIAPEKSFAALDANAMQQVHAVNTIGPALIAKHFLPLFPQRGRAVFAALSARVGSIGDNKLGGWHAYRASKAALNMLLKNLAIELARRTPDAICIGLHPGTVDTGLSKPFQANVAPAKLFSAEQAANQLLGVIAGAQLTDSGCVLAWDGTRVPA